MVNFPNHTTKFGSILTLNNLRYLAQPKRVECTFLVNRSTYFTLYLLNLYCCHFNSLLIL